MGINNDTSVYVRSRADVLQLLIEIEMAISAWTLAGFATEIQRNIFDGVLDGEEAIKQFVYASDRSALLPVLIDIMCTEKIEEPHHILQQKHMIRSFTLYMGDLVYYTCTSDAEIFSGVLPELEQSTTGRMFVEDIKDTIECKQEHGYIREK